MKARKTKKAEKLKALAIQAARAEEQESERERLEREFKDYRDRTDALIRGVRDGLLAVDGENYKYLAEILARRLTVYLEKEGIE